MNIILSVLATIIGIAAFIQYFRETFFRRTKPHAYTWLIWVITQGTAVVGIWYGGGGWGTLSLTVGALLVFIGFLFSLTHGTNNITRSDAVLLVTALSAILLWWQFDQPLLSVFMVSAIDVTGYIPSVRKSYQEPWSETLISWVAWSASNILAILALHQRNPLTMTYLIAITTANISLVLLCLFRRQLVPKPSSDR